MTQVRTYGHCWELNGFDDFFRDRRSSSLAHVLQHRELQENVFQRVGVVFSKQIGRRLLCQQLSTSHQPNLMRLARLIDVMCRDDDCRTSEFCDFN